MGDVYLAHDLLLERQVAIKFVSNQKTDDPTLARRLLKEAKGVAAIEHPNICPVFDAGTDEAGRPFIVMQYLEGQTLSEKLAGGPLSIKKAFEMCAQIADALAAAHEVGIVHRDLKPANIVLTSAGQPKVLDFGIAKFLPSSQFVSERETQTGLTQPYTFVGTPAYMSPEQIQGGGIDGRSDLFALGAVLFESLTGRPAFQGMQAIEILSEVLHVDPPPPSTLRPGVAPAQDDVCRQLLAKNPAERFQLATEAAAALRRVAEDDQQVPSAETRSDAVVADAHCTSGYRRNADCNGSCCGLAVAIRRGPPFPTRRRRQRSGFRKGQRRCGRERSTARRRRSNKASAIFPVRRPRTRGSPKREPSSTIRQARKKRSTSYRSGFPTREVSRKTIVCAFAQCAGSSAANSTRRFRAINGWSIGVRTTPAPGSISGERRRQLSNWQTATQSFERAIAIDNQFPAAYLHLGIVDYFTRAGRSESRRLRDTQNASTWQASNIEGADRGSDSARVALHQPRGIREGAAVPRKRSPGRADASRALLISFGRSSRSATSIASQGRFSDAERLAEKATDKALDSDLDVVAADGLIDLAITLHYADRPPDAAADAWTKRGAWPRSGAPAHAGQGPGAEMASVQQTSGDNAAAVWRPSSQRWSSSRTNRYLKWELNALNIAARALRDRDDITQAHEISTEAVAHRRGHPQRHRKLPTRSRRSRRRPRLSAPCRKRWRIALRPRRSIGGRTTSWRCPTT